MRLVKQERRIAKHESRQSTREAKRQERGERQRLRDKQRHAEIMSGMRQPTSHVVASTVTTVLAPVLLAAAEWARSRVR
ncbi:MAG: hypothetical protein IPH72_31850 [Sandaracinaceae bacterium]|nr:hypothetical protein [Sandaracinaceae bacterium]